MFLSKLFSIFKRKKDGQPQEAGGSRPAPSPPGTVGAAVGLSQPNQAVTSGPDKVAQGPSEPDLPKADVDAAADIINPQPTTLPPASSSPAPPASDAGPTEAQPPAEESSASAPDTSEPAPAPEEPDNDTTSGDDSQIAV